MPFIILCVSCKRKLRVLDRLDGKLIRCPACKTKFTARRTLAPAALPVASGSGRSAAPKSQPPAPAVRALPFPAPTPASEAAVEHGEEEFMAAPRAPLPHKIPALEEVETNGPPSSGKRHVEWRRQTPFLNVFVTLGGLLLLTALLGLGIAWWVNSKVQYLQGRPVPAKVK